MTVEGKEIKGRAQIDIYIYMYVCMYVCITYNIRSLEKKGKEEIEREREKKG